MNVMPSRRKDIELTELENEIVCFVPESSEGFFLNPTAALVLKNCDGTTAFSVVADLLEPRESADDLLKLTLLELKENGLLEPESVLQFKVTRSDLLRKWTVAAALPVIAAIMMPTPAEAQSACGGTCATCATINPCATCATGCACACVCPCACGCGCTC